MGWSVQVVVVGGGEWELPADVVAAAAAADTADEALAEIRDWISGWVVGHAAYRDEAGRLPADVAFVADVDVDGDEAICMVVVRDDGGAVVASSYAIITAYEGDAR